MAKSTRSKVKRHYRAKKREEGVYAAVEAARLERLSAKLAVVRNRDRDGDVELDLEEGEDRTPEAVQSGPSNADVMDLDAGEASADVSSEKKISTHGRRESRRMEWRASKGMIARPNPKGTNRLGAVTARRKPGRSKRRR